MTSLATVMLDALKAIRRRQELALANVTGNAFVLFLLYSWMVVSDRPGADLAASVLLTLIAGFCGLWLHGTTLAAFHPEVKETPFLPVLRRFHRFLPWAAGEVAVIVSFAWLGSEVSPLLWVVGVAAVLALLPMASQAAGDGFSRDSAIRVVTSEQYWLAGTLLLVVGIYLPFLLIGWIPQASGLVMSTLATAGRFGIAYALAVLAWVALAALIGGLGSEAGKRTPTAGSADRQAAALRQ